jgi:DNA-binding HxlR family transcriptional regulator
MPRQTPRADDHKTNCSVEAALSLIGGRWKGVVLFWLLKGKKRFSELRKILSNCSQRMLTVQLRELEEDGLVTRTVYAEVPPRVEYELTEFGRTLEKVLWALKDWGDQYKLSGVGSQETAVREGAAQKKGQGQRRAQQLSQ